MAALDADIQGPAKRARTAEDIVSYPGEDGSLAHMAATEFFKGVPASLHGVSSFAETFKAVSAGESHYGVIPIENSSSGMVLTVYDLLLEHKMMIVGELGVREKYCLCARSGTTVLDVGRVLSHPNILDACSMYISSRMPRKTDGGKADLVAMRSTVEAVRAVAEVKDAQEKPAAAIATREAAARFSLVVIADNIGNDEHLETRYVVIGPSGGSPCGKPAPFPLHIQSPKKKQSACFVLKDEPGAIFKLISCFALRNINVCRAETRPICSHMSEKLALPTGAQLWSYLFFLDIDIPVGLTPEASAQLWEAVKEFSLWQRNFGTFPSHVTRTEKKANWSEMVDLMAKG